MLTPEQLLPTDHNDALLVGRVFDPDHDGPSLVVVDGLDLVEITDLGPTSSRLLAEVDHDAIHAARQDVTRRRWKLTEVLGGFNEPRGYDGPRLLSPIDLQVIKAAGVTFVESMLERVIEERAKGDHTQAAAIRDQIIEAVGGAISAVRPGSQEAEKVKQILMEAGLWSQYLEVGIGPDPEIFTKAPVLSSVGAGERIGVLSRSVWNNPEPEVVLAVLADGTPVGATLGNDVNLRDFEGRSALLLTEAKDNNASCALGPFLRIFDDSFHLDDVRKMDVTLRVTGEDGFVLEGASSMGNISRDPEDLVNHAYGPHHRYPDGFVLFTGTLFAPTQDRAAEGQGFTHALEDEVRISTPQLGCLINVVDHAESAPPWEFGIWDLVRNLHRRSLLASH